MGSLVSDFPSLPQDVDPERVRHFTNAYQALTALGLPVPATPATTITRAALLAHLQAQAGALIKAEIAGNPDSVDYSGTDANIAANIGVLYSLAAGRRWPGSNATGYQVAAGSTVLGLVAVTNPGLADPGFLGAAFQDLVSGSGLIRFRAGTANPGRVRQVTLIPATNQLGLASPLPVAPVAGDIFDLGLVAPPLNIARISQVLRGFPFAPNALTAADITAAKV